MKLFRCPRCQQVPLFKGITSVVDSCAACGLAIKEHEHGDGPAFFAILLIGTLTGIFAAIVEVKYAPPFWLHGALWLPFILIGSLLSIRIFKAMLIAAQYRVRREDFKK